MNIIPINLGITTCYLIKTDIQYILIDTGYEINWDKFIEKIKEAGIVFSQISHIILTHHHDDHCGLINNILRENPSIRVVMSHLCKDLLLKGENDHTHGGGMVNNKVFLLMHGKHFYMSLKSGKAVDKRKNLTFTPYKTRDCDILVEGETSLRDIGIPLDGKIVETPGHTVDSISVFLNNGHCFVGDAAANILNFLGTKNCVIYITDMNQYYKSWETIINSGAKMIFPAHGAPFSCDKLKENIWKNRSEDIVPYTLDENGNYRRIV